MYFKPVVMLVYKRADLTACVLDAISKERPKQLFVMEDGPIDRSEENHWRARSFQVINLEVRRKRIQ